MVGGAKGKRVTPHNLLSAEGAPAGTFPVIDPFSRMLFVPQTSMSDTLAMHRAGVPSLCRLYLQGRCRQGSSCYQAHADVDIVQQLREVALQEPTCCETHGARSDTVAIPRELSISIVESNEGEETLRTTLERVVVTKGFRLMLKHQNCDDTSIEPALVVPSSSLCRLHTSGPCCRFGHECNFVHLCRELIGQTKDKIENNDFANKIKTPLHTDISITIRSPSQSNTKPYLMPVDVDIPMGISPVQVFSPRSFFFNRHTTNGILSLSGTPKLSTSPAMSRSYNSTSLGIVWRHNPYGGGSSASSVVET